MKHIYFFICLSICSALFSPSGMKADDKRDYGEKDKRSITLFPVEATLENNQIVLQFFTAIGDVTLYVKDFSGSVLCEYPLSIMEAQTQVFPIDTLGSIFSIQIIGEGIELEIPLYE